MARKKTDVVRTGTKIKGYKPMVINGVAVAVPVTKTNKVPRDFLRAVNDARSDKAKKSDAKIAAKKVLKAPMTTDEAKSWIQSPRKSDVKNVDAPRVRNNRKA